MPSIQAQSRPQPEIIVNTATHQLLDTSPFGRFKILGTLPSSLSFRTMDLVCETTPLLVAEHVLDDEATALPTSPTHKKSSPKAQQVVALMLITTVWPFSFEMIYPFINQVRFRVLRSPQTLTYIGAEVVYHGNWSYR
jgi:hypothetical protein